MSLTSHLRDTSSPVRSFLRGQFPNTRTFLANPRKRVREARTIRQSADVPWSTIGMALDYRIRYYFAVTPFEELVAYQGARMLTDARERVLIDIELGTRRTGDTITVFDRTTGKRVGIYLPEHDGAVALEQSTTLSEIMEIGQRAAEDGDDVQLGDSLPLAMEYREFFSWLDALTNDNRPVARRLPISEEDELHRHCVVLALMEEVFRTGRLDGVLATGEFSDAESLIGIAEPHWIDDLRELSGEFYDRFNHLLPLPHVLNPTFDGSGDVGGADADMIVDGVLLDIKTTVRPGISSDWIWQLLGYVLLDYADHDQIDGVGLYMSRQGMLIQWDLEEAMRSLCAEEPPNLEELRNRFRGLVQKPSHQQI